MHRGSLHWGCAPAPVSALIPAVVHEVPDDWRRVSCLHWLEAVKELVEASNLLEEIKRCAVKGTSRGRHVGLHCAPALAVPSVAPTPERVFWVAKLAPLLPALPHGV